MPWSAGTHRYPFEAMKRIAIAMTALALMTGCTSHTSVRHAESFVNEQLARKDTKQVGPKTLLTTGIAPNGRPYLLDAYRLKDGRICVEHAWEFFNGHGSQGGCTPDDHPRTTFQNWSTYPQQDDRPPDVTPWLVGIILDGGKAVKLRGTRTTSQGTQTQVFTLIRNASYPGNAFYIGRADIPELFEKVELLDAGGTVLASAEYVQE